MKKFLEHTSYVDFHDKEIQLLSQKLFQEIVDDVEKAKIAFEFVRDKIPHSFDIKSKSITAKASAVLDKQTGICHAKANLLAALLRGQGVPTGFCYQHLTLLDDDSKGYCLHCYNAVFVLGKWIKLDARGNTNGIDAQFSMDEPILAFPCRQEYDEYFISGIFATPHMGTMKMLEESNTIEDILENIPEFREDIPDISEQ